MITPVEVLGKELRRGFGYKAVEVDEFLEENPDGEVFAVGGSYGRIDWRIPLSIMQGTGDRELKPLPHDRRILKESIGSCGRDIQRDN